MVTAKVATENCLLALLAPSDLAVLLPHLEQRHIPMHTMLQERGRPLDMAYFPLDSVGSMVAMTLSGAAIEVAAVGKEGVIGALALLGEYSSTIQTVMQIPGEALKMRALAFKDFSERLPGFSVVLRRYMAALFTQAAQGSACNRLHSVNQRCARWLLHSHDRVRGNEFPLTHEYLATMLGVRRASVSEVASSLQQRRLIRYRRGVVAIEDRAGLKEISCECYGIVAGEYERLLGSRTKN